MASRYNSGYFFGWAPGAAPLSQPANPKLVILSMSEFFYFILSYFFMAVLSFPISQNSQPGAYVSETVFQKIIFLKSIHNIFSVGTITIRAHQCSK